MVKWLVFFLFLPFWSSGSDTLKIMHYNLLNYGNNTSYCHEGNNSLAQKDQYLATLINYTVPDIFTVNEMGASDTLAERILDRCMNSSGRLYYSRAGFSSNGSSTLANMVYFDSTRLQLQQQLAITTDTAGSPLTREVNVYKFRLRESFNGDTLSFHLLVCHLKAGSSSSDALQRARETAAIKSFIMTSGITTALLAGDLNIAGSQDDAFVNLVGNGSEGPFTDPIQKPGYYSGNSYFSAVHTQSTRSGETNNGCFSGGGSDDRFDYILISPELLNNSQLEYLNGSYKTIGQDGNHYDQPVNSPGNASAPAEIIEALYQMSDHYPVSLQLLINSNLSNVHYNRPPGRAIRSSAQTVSVSGCTEGEGMNLVDSAGRIVARGVVNADGSGTLEIPAAGFYLLILNGRDKTSAWKILAP